MTREAFIRKWLANKNFQYSEEGRVEMREDLDKVIDYHTTEQKLLQHGVSGKQPYYQLCPKCFGEGTVQQNSLATTGLNWKICPVCSGAKTLYVDPSTVACASGAVDKTVRDGKKPDLTTNFDSQVFTNKITFDVD